MSLASETFVVLDFDRTLGDTDKLFNVLGNLLGERDTVEWEAVKRDFIACGKSTDFLVPGTKDLLEYLTRMDIGHGILTYGGREWQEMKLAASGLTDVPTIITNDPSKGVTLRSWLQPDGTYKLPEEFASERSVRHLVLIDDKPSSFEGAPAEVAKLLVAGRFSSGADTHNVTLINDMYDALAFIK